MSLYLNLKAGVRRTSKVLDFYVREQTRHSTEFNKVFAERRPIRTSRKDQPR